MNKNQEAILISLVFLGVYGYILYSFQPLAFSATLPLLGAISFAFHDYDRYLTAAGLLIAFLVFLKIRSERQGDDSSGQVSE